MHLAWLTDVHLNFLNEEELHLFADQVAATETDAVLISGDISQAFGVRALLRWFADRVARPVYFVLGNHDYYTGSIAEVRRSMATLNAEHERLFWLPAAGPVQLSATTALVGHGGWADGRHGDWDSSTVELNDYVVIRDLAGLDRQQRRNKVQELADEAALSLQQAITACLGSASRIIVLTHVPPFREACLHDGSRSDENWLPHFSCKAVGDVLVKIMSANPDTQMLVLCGHTHGEGRARILPNLEVLTGGAVYGEPRVQRVIDLDEQWMEESTVTARGDEK